MHTTSVLPERLKYVLQVEELSQKEAAEKCGISEPTFCKYMSGKRTPVSDMLCQIANGLNVSTDFLLGAEPIDAYFGVAHWIESNGRLSKHVYCSKCRSDVTHKVAGFNLYVDMTAYKFCPTCGAYMNYSSYV